MAPHRYPSAEMLAFDLGIKPAVRLAFSAPPPADVAASLTARGFSVEQTAEPFTFPGGRTRWVLYAARSPELATRLKAAEALAPPGLRTDPEARARSHRALGELLGYPTCCVEAFIDCERRGVEVAADGARASERFVAAERAMARSRQLLGRLNTLRRDEGAALISFEPCAFDCEPAASLASAIFDALAESDADSAERLRERLLGEVAIERGGPTDERLVLHFERF